MRPRRSPSTPVVVIGCALAAALLVVVGFVASDIGGDDTSMSDAPAAEEATATATEDRLTAESRLGYAGLGPLRLGMSLADVERAGKVLVTIPSCTARIESPEAGLVFPDVGGFFGNGELWVINVSTPAISTISGIHVGSTLDDVQRTYPNAIASPGSAGAIEYSLVTITNPEGRTITFTVDDEGVVTFMYLTLSQAAGEGYARC